MLACASVCSVHTPARIRSLTRSCQRCSEDDTIGDLKKLVAAHAGTALRECGARETEGCVPTVFSRSVTQALGQKRFASRSGTRRARRRARS